MLIFYYQTINLIYFLGPSGSISLFSSVLQIEPPGSLSDADEAVDEIGQVDSTPPVVNQEPPKPDTDLDDLRKRLERIKKASSSSNT